MTSLKSPASGKKSKGRDSCRVKRKPGLIALAAKAVPTTWLDPLLTGPASIGNPPYDCRQVEQLLRGIRDRIRATSVQQ